MSAFKNRMTWSFKMAISHICQRRSLYYRTHSEEEIVENRIHPAGPIQLWEKIREDASVVEWATPKNVEQAPFFN